MATLTGATLAPIPFPHEFPVPTTAPGDSPLICVSVNVDWVKYIVGSLGALVSDSVWDSTDLEVVVDAKHAVLDLIQMFAAMESCPVPIQFRNDPANPRNFQYSLDGGTTWNDGPDQSGHFTPSFIADGTSPSGYDVSVNEGATSDPVPLLTANDPNALIKDPSTGDENVVEITATAPALSWQGTQLGGQLGRGGISILVNKILDVGENADPILAAVETGDYGTAIAWVIASL